MIETAKQSVRPGFEMFGGCKGLPRTGYGGERGEGGIFGGIHGIYCVHATLLTSSARSGFQWY